MLQGSTDQWNRVQKHIYGHLIYYLGVNAEQWEHMVFPINGSGSHGEKNES